VNIGRAAFAAHYRITGMQLTIPAPLGLGYPG